MHQAVLKMQYFINLCMWIFEKDQLLISLKKAFLNGHKHVKYMHVHVIINDKNEKILKNVIHSQAGGR